MKVTVNFGAANTFTRDTYRDGVTVDEVLAVAKPALGAGDNTEVRVGGSIVTGAQSLWNGAVVVLTSKVCQKA